MSSWNEPGKLDADIDTLLDVKRTGNPKESSIEAWGLVDGQPTSKHFKVRVYDDVVTAGSVGTAEMIAKTNEALALSDNLGTADGAFRFAGTRYHFNDAYSDIIKRKIAEPRIYACTRDGTDSFEPDNCVLMSPKTLAQKRRTQGLFVFSTQMLLKPQGDEAPWASSASGFDTPQASPGARA